MPWTGDPDNASTPSVAMQMAGGSARAWLAFGLVSCAMSSGVPVGTLLATLLTTPLAAEAQQAKEACPWHRGCDQ